MGDAFAPWHIILLVVVLLVLFGSKRLPGAATALGDAMKNFKRATKGLHDDDEPATPAETAQAQALRQSQAQQLPQPAPADVTQQQLNDLQRQLADLQRQNVGTDGAPVSGASRPEAQPNQQPF